jgi:hypothetical protein
MSTTKLLHPPLPVGAMGRRSLPTDTSTSSQAAHRLGRCVNSYATRQRLAAGSVLARWSIQPNGITGVEESV